MKKLFNFIILIFLFIITFAQSSFAQDYKITSVNYDTSNSIIFLTTQETIDEPILKSVKFVKMQNPTRAYFDIDSSVLTIPKQDWTFTANGLKKVKKGQSFGEKVQGKESRGQSNQRQQSQGRQSQRK